MTLMSRHSNALLLASSLALLAACSSTPPAPPPPQLGITDLAARPAERALLTGLRAYDDAQYPQAEEQLKLALKTGLGSPHDQAAAQKYLAFIYCTSQRTAMCEASFLAARQADPKFALSKGEAGHPLWGPVYKRVIGTP